MMALLVTLDDGTVYEGVWHYRVGAMPGSGDQVISLSDDSGEETTVLAADVATVALDPSPSPPPTVRVR